MKLKINETLLNKISIKKKYLNLIINKKILDIKNKEKANNSANNTPMAFSFFLNQKNLNIYNLMNKKYNFNQNIDNKKLLNKYRNIYNKMCEDNIKTKLFNKATSTYDSIDSINIENKNNDFIKSFNRPNIENKNKNNALIKSFNKTNDDNKLIIHRKLVILNKYQNSKRPKPKNQKQRENFLINSASSKKYHTILTKYNMNDIQNKNKIQEQGKNLGIFSSKNNNQQEFSKEALTPKKIFTNEEIKKIEFQNQSFNNKYLHTDASISKNNTLTMVLPKFINMPNANNLKKLQKKPTFFCQKEDVKKNIDLILQNNKNDAYENIVPITAKFWNSNNQNRKNIFNKIDVKSTNRYMQNNGIKYVSVNLNILTKIPNRIVHIDNHGNKINNIAINSNNTSNRKKRIKSHSDAFRTLRRNRKSKDKSLN